jgi:carboxypeptidase family protein/TonB-dependent receptor-like protein
MSEPNRPSRAGVGVLLLLALFAPASAPAAAQPLYGSVVGNVKDAQGGIVPGGTVTLVNTGTNLKRETTTDAQGSFNFVNVLAGKYDVRVALSGFREAVRSGVPVSNGEISRVDISLEIGAMSETVTVKSEAELLQTDKADVKTDLKPDEVVNLPLNQYRNYQALVVLVPGSLPPAFQNEETDTPQRSLNMTVNGQGGNANPTRTDGAMNVFVTMPHHTAYVAPAETIESVSITTGSMDAETGMAAGAAITVTTKSGTNTFKGSAFEFFTDERFQARPYYFGRGAPPVKLPVERQTAGGTLGGPILRNKLFFFSSYEGYFSDLKRYAFYSVPTAAMRNGDFSGALNTNGTLQNIFDPMTGDLATGNGRQQFQNNVIPAGRVNAISRTLVQMYPLPNVDGTGAGGLTNNYRVQQQAQTDRHNVDFKVNWNRTSSHQIWGKFSQMKAVVDDLFTFPIGASDDDGGQTTVRQYTVGHTWSLSPTLLLDSSFGASTQDQFVSSPDFHLGNMGLDLGVPGTNDQGRGDPRYAGLPQFSTGFTALGNTPSWSPIYRHEYSDSFNTNLTKVAGRHDLKAGYFVNHLTLDDWQPSVTNPRGVFSFNGNATRTFGTGTQTANIYNQYAQFLLGLVTTAAKGYQFQRFTANEFQHALFFRDRWTPTSKLTLDLGLRWEYYPIMRRKDYQIEMLDLNTLDMRIGGVGGNPKNMGLDAPKDSFAPRLGVVYRLNENTVLRTGYGLTYDAQGMSGELAFYGYQSYPLMLNASFTTPAAQSTFGWYGTLNQGIPQLVDPDLSAGRIPLPNTIGIQTAVPESVNRGKTHSWNVALERRLALVSVDVAYVGNRLRGGLSKVNANPVLHMGAGAVDRPYFISNGRQLPISIFTPYAKTDYDALQVGVTRPLTRGLLLKGHYTFGSTWSLGTVSNNVVVPNYELPTAEAQDRNWNPTSGSRRHTATMSFVYQLPWRSDGTRFSLTRAIINDWQVNGIFQAFSGAPFTVTADGTALNTPGNTQTADFSGTLTKIGEIGANGLYYDPAGFTQPEGVRFGTSRLNQFRGPGGWNLDFSVFRAFPITGRHRVELRVEGSNITNTTKFGNPTNSFTSTDFMRILGLNNAFAQRQVRLALRYSF